MKNCQSAECYINCFLHSAGQINCHSLAISTVLWIDGPIICLSGSYRHISCTIQQDVTSNVMYGQMVTSTGCTIRFFSLKFWLLIKLSLPDCRLNLFFWSGPLHGNGDPHPHHLLIGVAGWQCNASSSSCSNQPGLQVIISYFLAPGRLTTGTWLKSMQLVC